MFNNFLGGLSSGGGSGGGGDALPTVLNEVTFDEVEATADFANQLGPPPAGDITQTQEDAPPAVGIPLPLAPPGVRGGMIPPPPPPQQAGAAGPWEGQQPTGDTAYSGIDSIIKKNGIHNVRPGDHRGRARRAAKLSDGLWVNHNSRCAVDGLPWTLLGEDLQDV